MWQCFRQLKEWRARALPAITRLLGVREGLALRQWRAVAAGRSRSMAMVTKAVSRLVQQSLVWSWFSWLELRATRLRLHRALSAWHLLEAGAALRSSMVKGTLDPLWRSRVPRCKRSPWLVKRG